MNNVHVLVHNEDTNILELHIGRLRRNKFVSNNIYPKIYNITKYVISKNSCIILELNPN